jgi:hypothetical protein
MSVAVDPTMTMERFADKYANVHSYNTTDESVLHATEVLLEIAPEIVYEVSSVSVPFDGYSIEVSHVHTPEGELIVLRNEQGNLGVVTYVGDEDIDTVHQMVVDAVFITQPTEEEKEAGSMYSFDTEEELIEFLSHIDIEIPEDWYI